MYQEVKTFGSVWCQTGYGYETWKYKKEEKTFNVTDKSQKQHTKRLEKIKRNLSPTTYSFRSRNNMELNGSNYLDSSLNNV